MQRASAIFFFLFIAMVTAVQPAHAAGLTIGSGSRFALNNGSLNVPGDITITGTFAVGSGAVTLTGDWVLNGTFTAGTGMVTLNGTNQAISGASTFYNLTKIVSTADTLTFESGNKTTITNALNLQGASGQLLSLKSDSATQWEIDPQGTRTIQYLDVQGSKNVNAVDINAAGKNCVDSGNNTKWIFQYQAPTVTTTAVSSVTTNSATSGGNVTSDGGAALTAKGVCWSTSANPTISGSHTSDGTGTGTFTSAITGLTPNTTYHVRAYATNASSVTGYGSDKTFTTSTIIAPTVTTTAVSSVTTNSATSGGNVTSDGGAALTAKGVCWSTSANPTISGSHTSDGTGTGTFTSAITGLTPNTTYHVRAYATNNNNMTGYGDDLSFTTAATVPGGTYYINISSGSDSNDGSSAHPWKTLHHAISQINGGVAGNYVLHVALGTYNVSNSEFDEAMVLSQDNVIIIGERGSAPVIDGTGAQNWTKGIEITGSDVTIENLYVTGFSDTDEEGIRIAGGAGNEIRYCKVYGNDWGIRVNEAAQTTIQNCEIYENTTHGINDVSSTDTTIVENELHDNMLHAIRTQSSSLVSRNLIYDNTFGILVEVIDGSSASPTIKNNVIYEVVSGKMSYGIFTRANNESTVNPLIYHNTLDGGVLSGISMEEDGTGFSAPIVKYNIVTNFGQYGIQNSGADTTVEYNDVWNNTAGNYSGVEVISSTNISEDPLYSSYSLQSDSPCINTIPSSEEDPVTLDYPGFIRPRPGKTTKDMGAYEYVADETDNYTLPGGTGLATDYRIFTIPLNLGTGTDMLSVMENVLGAYDPVHWRAFLYNGTTYNEFNSSQFASHAIKPGMGFWIITTYTEVIPFKGQPAPDGVNYVMELDPGWHLIGLPWVDTNIFLSSIQVTDGVKTYAISSPNNDLTQKFLWDYTGVDGYVKRSAASFRLQNNKGYFFKVLSSAPIRMIVPNAANVAQSAPVDMNPNGVNTNDDEEPPPPPGAEPIPDIKANGQDGQITVNAGDLVTVSVGLNPGAWSGRNADWWIAAHTHFDPPLDWYTYVYPEGWKPGIHVGVQMPLFEFSGPFDVLKMILPSGNYTFYLAVDGNMDGAPDVTWMDSVQVKVE